MPVASASAIVPPSTSMAVTYMGLAFPVLLLLNVVVALYWIAKLRWNFLVPTLAILLTGNNVAKTIGINHSQSTSPQIDFTKHNLKVMSYNIRLFNFYEKGKEILGYINKVSPDVVCLQEFGYYTGSKQGYLTRQQLMQAMAQRYPHHHFCQSKQKIGTYGVALFSKHPITAHSEIMLPHEKNLASSTTISVAGDTLRVINVHLESNRLTGNDKKLWEKLSKADPEFQHVLQKVNMKLSNAYCNREQQALSLAEYIKSSDVPTIVCGDMNDVPVSFTYSTIAGCGLTDAFTEAGQGYCHTYNENLFYFRIDAIFHSRHFKAIQHETPHIEHSDHYPLVATLQWQ